VSIAGWRWGYGVFAILAFAAVPLMLLVVRDRPEDVQKAEARVRQRTNGLQEPEGASRARANPALTGLTVKDALHSYGFYFMTLGIVAANFSYAAVLTQLIPHLENEGVSLPRASLALSVLAGFGMGGKLLFGLLAERIPSRYALMLSLLLQVAFLVMLTRWANTPFLWAFMPFYGLAFGAVGALIPLLVQETFGVRYFGSILGLVNMATVVATIAGPLMVGAYFDAMGSYRQAFLTVAGIFVAGAMVLALARPPKRSTTY